MTAPNAVSDLADNDTGTPSVSWECHMLMCHVTSWSHFHFDLGQRLFTFGITELVNGSIVGIHRHPIMISSECALSIIASIASTLRLCLSLHNQAILNLGRDTVTVHLVGTETPRCEVHGVCHVSSVLLILWTFTRFMIGRSTLQARSC